MLKIKDNELERKKMAMAECSIHPFLIRLRHKRPSL